ncbi:MAG: DUF4382 domain-containing protein [Ectothiorhodospiraceae bacterium]|nr:DUF4382 domain-containing protein [Ectothiorhodospiraceae bacterium]MCH8504071.1 DUF4382 domain-containing protein [Ectothiorhodospiraceae bacterium]
MIELRRTGIEVAVLFGASMLLAGCLSDGDGSGGGSGEQTGTLSLSITDAPSDYADAVYLLVESVELKPASRSSVTYEIEEPERINLLDYQGADAFSLVEGFEVPAGNYEWIRLHVEADGVNEENASIVIGQNPGPYNPGEYPLFIPSAQQTGLKLVSGFTVPANGEASFVIDLDLRKAIHRTGAGQFMMRPTFRLIDGLTVGHIQGSVERELTEAEGCYNTAAGSQPWGSAVYLYRDFDATPRPISADLAPEEGGPVTTAVVDTSVTGDSVPFTIGFVEPGEYTVAFTCQSGRDSAVGEDGNLVDPSVDGDPVFYGQTRNVTVDASGNVDPASVSFSWTD